eukprot:3082082-Prorocentrum_lima.AAC.1
MWSWGGVPLLPPLMRPDAKRRGALFVKREAGQPVHPQMPPAPYDMASLRTKCMKSVLSVLSSVE